jgi:uncharacterized protein YkwD
MRLPGGPAAALILVILLVAFAAPAARAAAVARHSDRDLLRAMNRARTTRGLRGLRLDPKLRAAARAHSREMLRYDYFGHGSFGRRLSSFGVRGPTIGENLAWGDGSYRRAAVIVGEWLRSPEHRANLLRPGFRRVGVGSLSGHFAGHPNVLVVTADFAGT